MRVNLWLPLIRNSRVHGDAEGLVPLIHNNRVHGDAEGLVPLIRNNRVLGDAEGLVPLIRNNRVLGDAEGLVPSDRNRLGQGGVPKDQPVASASRSSRAYQYCGFPVFPDLSRPRGQAPRRGLNEPFGRGLLPFHTAGTAVRTAVLQDFPLMLTLPI